VLAATAKYRAEQDVLGQFLTEVCVVDPDYRTEAKELFARYGKWCEETRTPQLTRGLFGRKLTDRGFEPKDSNSKSWRLGLRIRAEDGGDADQAESVREPESQDLPF
jgi:putative DNA primase/helicase